MPQARVRGRLERAQAREQREREARGLILSFAVVSVVLFAAFYPVLTGVAVPRWYDLKFLKWLPSWPF